jgi:hypothetical protein
MKQKQHITTTGGNQEWLTIKDAATFWGVGANTVVKHLARYREYLVGETKGGGSGRRIHITKQGLIKLRNLVGTTPVMTGESHVDKPWGNDVKLWKANVVNKSIELEKENIVLKSELTKIVNEVLPVLRSLQEQVKTLTFQKDQQKQLGELSNEFLPAPTKEVPEMNIRAALNKFIREQAAKQNRYINILWSELYSQFYSRYGINITMRAKKKEMTVIEYAEEYDHLDDLYALARKIYKN